MSFVFFVIVQNAVLIIPQFTVSVKFFSRIASFSIFSLAIVSADVSSRPPRKTHGQL